MQMREPSPNKTPVQSHLIVALQTSFLVHASVPFTVIYLENSQTRPFRPSTSFTQQAKSSLPIRKFGLPNFQLS